MGLFSAIGKVLKGVSKVAGIIPGIGGTIKGITGAVGNILDHKQPLGSSGAKIGALTRTSVPILRGKSGGPVWQQMAASARGNQVQGSAPRMQAASPVLPGGAVVTSSGPVNAPSSGSSTRRKTTKKRKAATKRRKSSSAKKRRSTGRKLKFGSAAYRKKYLGHR